MVVETRPTLRAQAALLFGLASCVALAQPQTGLVISKIIFKSDYGILKGGPDNYASDGTFTYTPRGYVNDGRCSLRPG